MFTTGIVFEVRRTPLSADFAHPQERCVPGGHDQPGVGNPLCHWRWELFGRVCLTWVKLEPIPAKETRVVFAAPEVNAKIVFRVYGK